MRRLLLCFVLSIQATASWAQVDSPPAVFLPSAPSEADVIRATFTVMSGCTRTSTTTVSGSTVRTDVFLTDCLLGPPPIQTAMSVFFGPLQPRTYTYEVYVSVMGSPLQLRSAQPLVVTASTVAVPVLSPVAVWMLLAGLALFAWVRIGAGPPR